MLQPYPLSNYTADGGWFRQWDIGKGRNWDVPKPPKIAGLRSTDRWLVTLLQSDAGDHLKSLLPTWPWNGFMVFRLGILRRDSKN